MGMRVDVLLSTSYARTVHVMDRHAAGTTYANKTLFPGWMNEQAIERAIREAYRYGRKLQTQGERVLIRGEADKLTIEMWVNVENEVIETAYPAF